MIVGLKERILQALEIVKLQKTQTRNLLIVEDYSKPNVSLKVEGIILSHIDYVNSKVAKRILIYTNHFDPEQFKINEAVSWL